MKKILRYSLLIYLLSLPFSFPYVPKFLQGFSSDTSFLLFGVYLSDITGFILLTLIAFHFYSYKNSFSHLKNFFASEKKIYLALFGFVFISLLSFWWSGTPLFSFLLGFRMVMMTTLMFFVVYLLASSRKIKIKWLSLLALLGVVQSVVGFWQVMLGKSLGLYLLGESQISPEVLGLARFSFLGNDHLRAYGTLPHPNVLGGFLLLTISATLVLRCWEKNKNNLNLALGVQLFGLVLTFSRSALLGLIIILILNRKKIGEMIGLKIIKNKILLISIAIISLAFLSRGPIMDTILLKSESSQLRSEYLKANIDRFLTSPLLGRGFGTGPIELPAFSNFSFYPWENQPVHNIFLLVLADLGILGLGFFLFFILKIFGKIKKAQGESLIWGGLFLAYLFIGLFDHYLLTLPQGIFIFLFASLVFLATSKKVEKKSKEQ